MVRAGRIARRWTDATVCLGDQLVVRQSLVGGIAPELLAHALVHMLGEGFGETVGQRLGKDARVIVVLGGELALDPLVQPDAGGHRERSEEHTSELQSLMRISYAV